MSGMKNQLIAIAKRIRSIATPGRVAGVRASEDAFLTAAIRSLPQDWLGEDLNACTENTRRDVIEKIQKWVEDAQDDSPTFLFLDGFPGAGKSAVARSIAAWAKSKKILGAAMYPNDKEWCRAPEDPKLGVPSSTRFYPSMVRQLLESDSDWAGRFRQIIDEKWITACKRLRRDSRDLVSACIAKLRQAQAKTASHPLLLIIDSLESPNNVEEPDDMFDALVLFEGLPAVKVLITSRPGRVYNRVIMQCRQRVPVRVSLSDYNSSVVYDIRTFFTSRLGGSWWRRGVASKQQIKDLAAYAGVFFGIAVHMVGFIGDAKGSDLKDRLSAILDRNGPHITWSSYCRVHMENQYQWIINTLQFTQPSQWVLDYHAFMGAISICRPMQLERDALALIAGKRLSHAEAVLHDLRIVLADPETPRFYPGFLDVVCDRRITIEHPHPDKHKQYLHEKMALNCFWLLGYLTDEVELQERTQEVDINRVERSVRDSGISYATHNWAYHLSQSGYTPDSKGKNVLESFEDPLLRGLVEGIANTVDRRLLHRWAVRALLCNDQQNADWYPPGRGRLFGEDYQSLGAQRSVVVLIDSGPISSPVVGIRRSPSQNVLVQFNHKVVQSIKRRP
jgi:DNA replication protein DnaC